MPTAKIRLEMQKTMQAHAAVFRTQKSMEEGVEKLHGVIESFDQVAVSDRSMIWNSDLVDAAYLILLVSGQLVCLDETRSSGVLAVAEGARDSAATAG